MIVSRIVTSAEITSPKITGRYITGSHRKWRHRKLHHRKCKGDNFSANFFSSGFWRVFSSETPWVYSENFWEFPIELSILTAEISTNENLGNSTNEMPQSLFQLANHGSPYRSNESIRTIYFYPFVEALSVVQSNSNGNLCFFRYENRHFRSSFHSHRTCLSCGIENLYSNKGKHLNPTIIF